ncbi:MAG: hypothetical protein ACRD22_04315 [Terriglobia bacterium]
MHQFDVVLKILLRDSIARVAGKPVARWIETELPRVQKRSIDMLGETADGELIHIEIQSGHDEEMRFRMLQYLGLIARMHRRIPRQVLLYAGRERLRMPSEITWADGFHRYQLIDMLGVDGEPLLASPEPSDNVLAILARLKDSRDAVRRILESVSRLPGEKANEYFQALLIIAGLRGLEEAVQQEAQRMQMIDLSQNRVLGPAYLQGRKEGREEMVRQLIEQRLGNLPEWVEQKLSQSSTEELAAVGLRVPDAASFEDLFR